MKRRFTCMAATAAAFVSVFAMTTTADAACTRLAFSVNDYGKVGPANDAKRLLDDHIKSEMAKRGVSNYRTGKKSVSCELFIDVILFDEYTCRAEATVCWGQSGSNAKPVEAKASKDDVEPISTGSIDEPETEDAPDAN